MNELTRNEFARLANNFYQSNNIEANYDRIGLNAELINYFALHNQEMKKKYKVAFCCICLNPFYWEYANEMMCTAKQFFLPGHDTDFFLWSDIPDMEQKEGKDFLLKLPEDQRSNFETYIKEVRAQVTIFPTEPIEWPMPTLLRYSLFLQQEEKLKEYDYIFYCDIDMKFVGIVGDEILGQGLTAAPHPGYVIRKELWPPFEPNKESASFIKRPGILTIVEGKPRFMPFYAAGGFQGGKTENFLKAMKETKKLIDKDLNKAYIPIWNDESAWNKYIFDYQSEEDLSKMIFLTPSYIYPDSLIKEYYEPIVWGYAYPPKLMTLTKKFATSKEGGEAIAKMINQ